MSRDAKVGLVIVFAFVFLLGTILVHRFNFSDLGRLTGGRDTAGVDPDSGTPTGVTTSEDHSGDSTASATVTTVDAVAEENLNSTLPGSRSSQPFDTTITGSQQLTGQPNATRQPVETSETSDNGAHISLSNPRDEQPSAVVESHRPSGKQRTHDNTTGEMPETEVPETRPSSQHRSPLLEISRRPNDTGQSVPDTPKPEATLPSTTGEVTSINSKEPATEMPADVADPPDDEPDSIAQTPPGRRVPPLNRPPAIEPDEDPDAMETGSDSIQQAADKRRPEPDDSTPPRLPKYGDPPQAIIESVPDRDSRSTTPRNADRSNESVEPFTTPQRTSPRAAQSDDHQIAGQKTYLVKEGDNFWSISARQYGTGKYFRALEEFNKDRLSASGNGGKVLRPGTVIALPDESLLQSTSARKKPAEPAASKPSKHDPWKEDSSAQPLTSRDTEPPAKRDAASPPGTYRVKEGDTLSTISLHELGTSKRWQEIFQLNRRELDDPQSLKAGMLLKLPPATTAEKAAGRPNF